MDIEGITVESLDFEWRAIYNDGTKLYQHYGVGNEKGEHHFGHIDQEKLVAFQLVAKDGKMFFGVDLLTQSIIILGLVFHVEFPRDHENNVCKGKLVYFRRVRHDFTANGTVTGVRYVLGLQAAVSQTTKKGVVARNYQQYVFVNPDGTFTLSQSK